MNFVERFFEKDSNIKIPEYSPVGAQLFHADEQTDRQTDRQTHTHTHTNTHTHTLTHTLTHTHTHTHMTKLIVAFSNFANTPKNAISCICLNSCRFLALLRGDVLNF